MGFSFLVWNIRHFQAKEERTQQVRDTIRSFSPDIFGILEFQGKIQARRLAMDFFPDYDFSFTDSKIGLEILIGCKRGKFDQILYTQRRSLQVGNINLRPGGLISVRQKNSRKFDNLLFLHTDSGRGKTDYDNRQKMFKKIWDMNKAIKSLPIQQNKARLIVLGDLNTMGKSGSSGTKSISSKDEIEKLERDANNNEMRFLSKSHEKTWSNNSSSKTSDLDHAIASNDLNFKKMYFPSEPLKEFELEVNGWNYFSDAQRRDFIKNISDHCLLFGIVSN